MNDVRTRPGAPLSPCAVSRSRTRRLPHRPSLNGRNRLIRLRCHRRIVVSLRRARYGSWLATLLLAALVLMPAVDCLLFDTDDHPAGHHAVTTFALPDADTGHDHTREQADAEHCVAPVVHCPSKALPPATVSMTLVALILAAFTALWTAPASAAASTHGGVRGPPNPLSADGRTVLTLFCISRR